MFKAINKTISEFERVSYMLAKYGILLACLMLGICVVGEYINCNAAQYSITLRNNLRLFGESGVMVFAESIIGSLLFDYNAKKRKHK